MYFYKLKGRQMLDLRGNLILSHNANLVTGRIKSAAPAGVRNAVWVEGIPTMTWRQKLRVTLRAIAFIWGASQALVGHPLEQDEAE